MDCIYEGERMLYIHPDECVDCGACEPVCPVEAIFYEDDLPEKWQGYLGESTRFFAEPLPGRDAPLGSPGGAAKLGVVGADTPFVAGLPREGDPGQRGGVPVLADVMRFLMSAEGTVRVIVYGDFNCPYSYLASQRADQLIRSGMARIDWRAVEHDRALAVTGTRAETQRAAWDSELADVAALALPGEDAPAAPPSTISNTGAAVAAYAEAVTDGVADDLRRLLFHAIWVQRRHLSSAYEVRRVVTCLMRPPEDIRDRLASQDIPSLLHRDPDLARIVRRSGGTIAPDGGPLTTAGWQRIRQWRGDWLALQSQVIPAVIGPDGVLRSGADGLRYLADLARPAAAAGLPARPPAGAGQHRLPSSAAWMS